MPKYRVLLVATQWHSKYIIADTKEQAQDIAFAGTLDLSQWQYDGLGDYENYNTLLIEENENA
jgi:hypothetical protein